MKKIISIGSALVDIFIHSKDFEVKKMNNDVFLCQTYGSKIELDGWQIFTGGGGTNTAIGFSRLGFQTSVITEMGCDFLADLIERDLKNNKVDISLLIKEKQEKTGGSAILISSDGGRTIMINRGASALLNDFDINEEKLSQCDWFHLSSISGQLATLNHIFETAKKYNLSFSFNPGKKELELIQKGILKLNLDNCKIFIVNLQEWKMIKNQQEEILKNIETVVVTDGKNGGQIFSKIEPDLKYEAKSNISLDDTGAGDAFCVGLVAARLNGKKLNEAVLWGSFNASSVVNQIGAKKGLLTKTEMETKLKTVNF
jgi:ribokinase